MQRRIISIFLPQWPIEAHLRRSKANASALRDKPFALIGQDGQKQILTAVNPAAAEAGLTPGMMLTHARAILPTLSAAPGQALEDAKALHRLAVGCLRFSPWVAPAYPDSLWIDATGVAHLFGGETAMATRIARILARNGLTARVAMASTPGAAWAWSRHGSPQVIVAERNGDLGPLPVSALRLSPDIAYDLWRVGVKTIGELKALPRAGLPLRFGADVLKRLDQASGRLPEAIDCITPPKARRQEVGFAEPISTPEDLRRAADLLMGKLCADLERADEGVRKLDLIFRRCDHHAQAIRIGTAKPSRDPVHLLKLLAEHFEEIDPGFGIEAAALVAWRVARLIPTQTASDGRARDEADLAVLVDCLANRIGEANIRRLAPVASHIPERAQAPVSAMSAVAGSWPASLPRPVRLFSPPEPVEVTALLPDHPPARFAWRGRVCKIRAADGPERILGEWWTKSAESTETRDYFRVEDEDGGRYWLFRDNRLSPNQHYAWFLHGMFA